MFISIDRAMDDIEELIRDKAISENFIKDLNTKRDSIDTKLQKCKYDLKTIEKKLQIKLLIVEVLKLKEDELITNKEAEEKVNNLDKELEAFISQNEVESS